MSEQERPMTVEDCDCYVTSDPKTTRFCPVLTRFVRGRYNEDKGPGVWELVLYDMRARREVMRGPCLKQDRQDKGVMLNFCPFCGAKLLEDGKPVHGGETSD